MATTRSRGASVRRAPYFPDPIGLPVSHGDTVSTDLVVEGSPFRTVTGSQPSEAAARIGVLDVLRGFALFGMVLVHFNGRAPSASGLGGTFQRLIELFVETRAYTVFAILFGVGFAIQLRRSEARGDSISVRFIRRLVALLCFGLVAEFGFGYHVLVGYALMGFPLLLVRNWSTRALLVAAFFCVAITGLYRISLYSYRTMTVGIESAQAAATRTQTSYTEDFQAFVKAGQSSTFAGAIAARARLGVWRYARPEFFLPGGDFTCFLLGMIGLRLRLFERPREHRRTLVGVMTFGLFSWAMAEWALPLPGPDLSSVSPLAQGWMMTLRYGLGFIAVEWLALAYIAAVLLFVAPKPAWLGRLALFGFAGRMALTNYMIQAMVLSLLFDRYGFGRSITAQAAPLAALSLFGAEAFVSRWWLARFRYGPLEWIWRSVTYWRVQPFRQLGPAPTMLRSVYLDHSRPIRAGR